MVKNLSKGYIIESIEEDKGEMSRFCLNGASRKLKIAQHGPQSSIQT